MNIHLAGRTSLKTGFVLTYGTGQIVEIMMLGVIAAFLMFYLTAVCGLRPDLAGLVLFISLAVDAVLDPVIGAMSDGWKSRWGRRHPFMLVGSILLPVTVFGVFVLPTGLPKAWVFGYMLALSIVMRISQSLFILPYAALLAEFSRDYRERARMMTYRLVLAVVSWGIVFAIAFKFIFKGEDSLSQASSYVPFALLVGSVIFVSGLVSTLGTLRAGKSLPTRTEAHPPLLRVFREVGQVFRNPSFVALFFGALVFMTSAGFLTSINVHVLRYFWSLTPEQMQLPTVAQPIGMMFSIPLSIWFIRSFEKRTIMLTAALTFAGAYAVLPLFKVFAPGQIDSAGVLALVVVSGVVFGIGSGLSFIATGSMVADATDEHDRLFRVRREGLFFASLVFGAKTALGLGGLLAGLGLQLIGFPSEPASPEGAAQLTPQVIERLGLLWGPGFACCMLLSMPFFLAYKLDREAHEKIVREINGRASGEAEGHTDAELTKASQS